jgi:predicted site-specific integrase-resolvase
MNLSDWAGQVGVSKYAVCRWCHAGTLPVPARRAGRLILVGPQQAAAGPGRIVIYARVSSADQRPGLGRQVARLAGWVTAGG